MMSMGTTALMKLLSCSYTSLRVARLICYIRESRSPLCPHGTKWQIESKGTGIVGVKRIYSSKSPADHYSTTSITENSSNFCLKSLSVIMCFFRTHSTSHYADNTLSQRGNIDICELASSFSTCISPFWPLLLWCSLMYLSSYQIDVLSALQQLLVGIYVCYPEPTRLTYIASILQKTRGFT